MASDWVFPVVGSVEYSGGSYMAGNTKSHRGRSHKAIDIYAAEGTPIVTPVGGTVQETGSGKTGGNYARIIGDDGVIYYFAHMQSRSHLRAGQRVEKAVLVGFVGRTGSAKTTKPHLHFSMRTTSGHKAAINPKPYLDGAYRLDAAPGTHYNPETQEETQGGIAQPPQERFAYASAADVTDAVMGGDELPEPLTAGQILGSTLSSVSNAIAGGQREDYRGLGTAGVPRSELELLVKKVGDGSAVDMEGAQV